MLIARQGHNTTNSTNATNATDTTNNSKHSDTKSTTLSVSSSKHHHQQQHLRRKPDFPKLLWLQWIVGILSFFLGMSLFRYSWIVHGPLELSFSSIAPCHPSTTEAKAETAARKGSSRFAYAFLISGCNPTTPLTYRPFLWNILVAAKNLRQTSVTLTKTNTSDDEHDDRRHPMDIVVMVQFSRTSTTSTLPRGDIQWLELYENIHIHYLPPLLRDSFYGSQLAKFHILELTNYERVLYLDADVMPLCSLDYIFHLSTTNGHGQPNSPPLLFQPNVVLAWFTEPAHGGWFMLQPFPGAYQQLQDIIEQREQHALTLPYPHWDPIMGWGQSFVPPEEWQGLPQPIDTLSDGSHIYGPPRHSSNWTFHGDFADQGLLYYWTRFHCKAVSILYLDHILEYVGDAMTNRSRSNNNDNDNVMTQLRRHSCLPSGKEMLGQYGSTLQAPLFYDKVPHRDFIHFSGTKKPWETRQTVFRSSSSNSSNSSTDYWYAQLEKVWNDFAETYPHRPLPTLPLKFKPPPLGRYPTHRSVIGTIKKKLRKQQQQQQQQQQ